jgi:hypothetical protein
MRDTEHSFGILLCCRIGEALAGGRHRCLCCDCVLGETADVLRLVLSDDCHLRLFEEADAEELHRLIDANRAHTDRRASGTGSTRRIRGAES